MRAVLALLPIVLLVGQQRDASTQPTPAGTGEISGRVMSADSTPQPLRRAVVTLTGDVPNPRSVLTEDDGRFVFSKLPAGTFTVTARKAAYLTAPFGARRPGRPGMPIVLNDGQRQSISIVMFRGAAITGILRDRSGPMRGVEVRAIDARTLLIAPDAVPTEVAVSDDRGVYRIYGLPPGDYVVVGLPRPTGTGDITAPSASSIDAALAMLAARRPVAPGAKPAPVPPPAPQPAVGFAPVFYPGTANHTEAASVRVEAGEDRTGVDFEVRFLPMASIDGVVRGDVANLAAARISIIPSGADVETLLTPGSISGRPIDAAGRFRFSNLAPGRYRVVARAERGTGTPPAPAASGGAVGRASGAAQPAPSTGDYLYGVADVELRGEDAANVALTLQPGGTISGRIMFARTGATPAPEDLSRMRVTLSLDVRRSSMGMGGLSVGPTLITNPITVVRPDGAFEIRGIGPGRFILSASLPSAAEAGPWTLQSATIAGRNVLDEVLELGPGVDVRDVTIRFSDQSTQLSGTLQGVSGELITEYYIVASPADRSMWRPRARRIQSVRPATNGRFVFNDLLAGEYILAALTDLDPIDLWNTALLAQIAAAGAPVTVADGEKKVHDLRIR